MRKATTNERSERGGARWLAATSLAFTLAAFGCSMNRYPGNGEPASATPAYEGVNHSSTTGSSSGTEGVPPMASSYTGTPRVNVDALAILAAEQGYRGRVLGPVNPDGIQSGVTVATGQFQSPALVANPQSTVNSSISSQPTPVITGGDLGAGVTIAAANGVTTLATTGNGTTVATTGTTAATGALTTSTTAVTGATTIAGSAAFAPAFMNSTPPPQATGSVTPMPSTLTATGRPTAATRTTAASSKSATTTHAATLNATNTSVVPGIQLVTGTQGQITMTNVDNHTSSSSTTGH